ncbi:hypothetical protein J6590_081956 [Homalodisca vitripennis]|nr:hypothetical protein J6590_081956 [Homalodisca vitripennis]
MDSVNSSIEPVTGCYRIELRDSVSSRELCQDEIQIMDSVNSSLEPVKGCYKIELRDYHISRETQRTVPFGVSHVTGLHFSGRLRQESKEESQKPCCTSKVISRERKLSPGINKTPQQRVMVESRERE